MSRQTFDVCSQTQKNLNIFCLIYFNTYLRLKLSFCIVHLLNEEGLILFEYTCCLLLLFSKRIQKWFFLQSYCKSHSDRTLGMILFDPLVCLPDEWIFLVFVLSVSVFMFYAFDDVLTNNKCFINQRQHVLGLFASSAKYHSFNFIFKPVTFRYYILILHISLKIYISTPASGALCSPYQVFLGLWSLTMLSYSHLNLGSRFPWQLSFSTYTVLHFF